MTHSERSITRVLAAISASSLALIDLLDYYTMVVLGLDGDALED